MNQDTIKNPSLADASPRELADAIVRILDEKKARDIKLLKFAEGSDLTDYFVIMTGTSNTHIRALADHIEESLKKNDGLYPHHVEGVTSNWVLMDYSSVVVNIFTQDTRELFALERLWADGEEVDISSLLK